MQRIVAVMGMLAMICQSMVDQPPTAQGGATKWGDQREELLTEPMSNDLSLGVLLTYLEITPKHPGSVSELDGVDKAILADQYERTIPEDR